MKRILIILANYDPNPSSVANCMQPLIKKMSEIYHVDIITNRNKVDIPEYELKDDVNIYRVDDYRTMNSIYLNRISEIKSSSILKIITRIFTLILKTLYYIRYVLFAQEKEMGGWEVNRVYKKYCELTEEISYEMMISVSLPFQSHYAAEVIKDHKGKNIKWMVFEFDPFAFNKRIKVTGIRRKKMFIDEKRILKKCDSICLTPELYYFYKEKKFIQFSKKVSLLSFANLEQLKCDFNNVGCNFMKDGVINCLFAGHLYDDIRNPSVLLHLFSKVDEDINLSMMTSFSDEKIKKYAPLYYSPTVIPFQNRDTAIYNLKKADILINIGNTVEFQVPAKIFEYMSTGKPIVHLSKIKNDPALKYLNHYSLLFVVNEWEVKEREYVHELEKFCKENKGKQLTFEEVNENLGEYADNAVIKKFLKILNTILGEKCINE